MSKAERDLRVFLSPDSDLPPDVFFRVQGIEEETFEADRFALAAVSPVFRRMFFGPMKEMVEVIEVKETTPEAFDCMIKFVYEPQGGDIFKLNHVSCPQKIFELLTLVNKYQILSLATLCTMAWDALNDLTSVHNKREHDLHSILCQKLQEHL